MAFTKKEISVTVKTPSQSYTFQGLRTSVHMEDFGGPTLKSAEIHIFGVAKDSLLALSSYQPQSPLFNQQTTVEVYAGDAKNGMQFAFGGMVMAAWADMVGIPNTALQIVALGQPIAAAKPTAPTTFPGDVDVTQVMQTISGLMGLTLHSNLDKPIILRKPYFWGTPYEQMLQCADAAHVSTRLFISAGGGGWLSIWPVNGSNGSVTVEVSPATGLVGYPAFDGKSVAVTTLYNPLLKFGSTIKVTTDLGPANGTFIANAGVLHHIESYTYNGAWFTQAMGMYLG